MQKRLLFKIDYVCKIPPRGRAGSFLAYSLLCRKSRSLLGYANISASIVSLQWLIVSKTFLNTFNTFEPHDKNNKVVCAPSEDSDQPGHPPCLIRVFAVRTKKAWFLNYPLSGQRRLWSDWADAHIVYNCIRKKLSRTEYSFFVENK